MQQQLRPIRRSNISPGRVSVRPSRTSRSSTSSHPSSASPPPSVAAPLQFRRSHRVLFPDGEPEEDYEDKGPRV
jgi:hypothetical protein